MILFLIFLVIPIAAIVFSKIFFHREYTWKESWVHLGIGFVAAAVTAALAYASVGIGGYDRLILNGQVTDKYNERVHCRHSYTCNCRTVSSGSGANRTTTTVCDTCYEHLYDVDWIVETSVGDHNIEKEDRRGLTEPKRFSEVKIGDPASNSEVYMNYVKANPNSMFNVTTEEKYEGYNIPEYPSIYDYYKVNHVIDTTNSIDPRALTMINKEISMHLRTLGESKQVNIVLVFTDQDINYAEVIKNKWLGGKKNDVVVVVGTNFPKINWVKSFGWSESSRVFLDIETRVTKLGSIQPHELAGNIVQSISLNYERQPFEKYKYLLDEMEPSILSMVIAAILNILCSAAAVVFFVRTDHFR